MYYIASLAKFDNHCSTVRARRQDQWEGNNYSLSFRRMQKKFTRFFLQRIFGRDFLSPHTTIFSGIETIPALHILLLWRSSTVATVLRPLKSAVRNYISPRINFLPLYMNRANFLPSGLILLPTY